MPSSRKSLPPAGLSYTLYILYVPDQVNKDPKASHDILADSLIQLLFFYQTMHPADRGGRMELPGLPGGLYTVFATDDDQGFGEVFNRVKFETRDHPFDVGENGRNPSLRGDSSFRVVAILKVGDLPSTKALCGALDKANKPYNGMSMLNLVAPRLQQAMAQKFPARGDPRPLIIQTTLSLLRQAEGLDVTQTIPSEKSGEHLSKFPPLPQEHSWC